jgi:hypothetical protein
MKHMKTVEVPAETREVLDMTTCDLCGAVIKPGYGNAEEVEVKHRTGSSYTEGGSGVDVRVDMCGTCFDTKLVPWLRTQGADPKPEEWDW